MAPMSPQTAPKASATADSNPPGSTNAPALAPTTEDTAVPDAPPTPNTNTPNAKKRKRKDKPIEKQTHIFHQTTFRKTSWSYFHLILLTPGTASLPPTTTTTPYNPSPPTPTPTPSLSPLLTSTLLTSPLRAYLGTTGTAIPIDTLKIHGREVWVRIPRQDARGFRASLSGWVGSYEGDQVPGVEGVGQGQGRVGVAWRVVAEGGVLGCLGGSGGSGDGGDLFG